jgi:hypothetical protein
MPVPMADAVLDAIFVPVSFAMDAAEASPRWKWDLSSVMLARNVADADMLLFSVNSLATMLIHVFAHGFVCPSHHGCGG